MNDVMALAVVLVVYLVSAVALLVAGLRGLRPGASMLRRGVGIGMLAAAAALPVGLLAGVGMGGRGVLFPFFLGFGLFLVTLWATVLADCAVNETDERNERLVWVIIIVFTNIVGAALYLFVRRPRRLTEASG